MAKITRASPDEKALAEAIRNAYNGAFLLTLEQVREVIGKKSTHTAREWVSTLTPRKLNGRKVYLVSDVAHKIIASIEGQETSA